jgi:hypothetical protein
MLRFNRLAVSSLVVLRVTLVLLAVRSSSTLTVDGVHTVEVHSPEKISPRSTVLLPTPPVGLVSCPPLESDYSDLFSLS